MKEPVALSAPGEQTRRDVNNRYFRAQDERMAMVLAGNKILKRSRRCQINVIRVAFPLGC
jgi:hypothetical protein